METETTETNGKSKSALYFLQKEFEATAKAPTDAIVKSCKKDLLEALSAVDKARAAVDAAQGKADEVSLRVIKLCGANQPLQLGGDVGLVTPTARGDRVFYKRVGQKDAL
jgi:hypothetical protein